MTDLKMKLISVLKHSSSSWIAKENSYGMGHHQLK